MAGRPPFKPSPALRKKVAVAAGGGMSHEEIAIALGISRNTLEKHFEHELSVGALQKRMEALSAAHKAAKGGNVAAIRFYLQNSAKLAAPPLPQEEPEAVPLGKKEQANADAKTVQKGTEWEGLLTPSPTVQ